MSKLLGAIFSSIVMVVLFSTIPYWKDTSVQNIFTMILAIMLVIGANDVGAIIGSWLETNDTTRT